MTFFFFRPVFWLMVCWIFVYTYYADAGLAVDSVDKANLIRQSRQYNSSRVHRNNTNSDKDVTMPNSSHSIFHTSTGGNWIDKLHLLSVMLISGMGVVGKLVFSENHPDILLS